MKQEQILTAKEWLEKETNTENQMRSGSDMAMILGKECHEFMEKYANYKNKVLEDRIKEFKEKLKTEYDEQGYFRDWAFNDFLLGYDKHFNIK